MKKSRLLHGTSFSSPLLYPTLPNDESWLRKSPNIVTESPNTEKDLSQCIEILTDSIDAEVTHIPYSPTPTSTSRHHHRNFAVSVENDFITFKEQIEETDIETKIYRKLIDGPGQLKSPQILGRLYCALRKQSPGYTKIGWTTDDLKERMNQLSPKSRFGTLKATASVVFVHFKLAERVVHLELWNQRKESKFAGDRGEHSYNGEERGTGTAVRISKRTLEQGRTEWFKIEGNDANEVCAKWVNWLRQCEPYNQDGKLKAFWESWFTRQIKTDPYCSSKHRSLHLRWKALLNPTRSEVCLHYMAEMWTAAGQFHAWARANRRSVCWTVLFFLCFGFVYAPGIPLGFAVLLNIFILSLDNNAAKRKR
ncbi:hypothetical protein BGW36DRAFT_422370 [Talaromyces proteolyticus]|uniref:Bacteriophage T5 Orf172 DNA-binding domain-containing protein n=1 Tax=Talaromyces proteolyticus TaxID=1131652 RepID=A0AAD4L4I9_9EURO|nr:uncharacterized protein BGW36DRAFT_422370 [Talaromyces proteolyticus]KAH8705832.1 hypothetical protein BGW36DRAFT_422370 [Talaromyces proteolyticus]